MSEVKESVVKHTATAGPWSVMWQNSRKREYPGLHDFWETPVQVGGRTNAGNVICTVLMGGPGATDSDKESVEANARLIAAAPDYAAAAAPLAQLVEFFGGDDSDEISVTAGELRALAAAHAKATGSDQ